MRKIDWEGVLLTIYMLILVGTLVGIGYVLGHAHGVCYALENVRAIPIDSHMALVDIEYDLMSYFK